MKYSLGIDLGGMSIALGLIDSNFNMIAKSSVKTPVGKDGDYFADVIAAEAQKLCSMFEIETKDLNWAGMGIPGHTDSDKGEIIFACNIGLENIPMGKMLEDRLGCKVYLGNDANCAALAEAMAGNAKNAVSSVTITIGTGIGMGIVSDGKIVNGCHYCAGEIGHMVIVKDGRPCNCGRKGCFETYASATALIRSTKEAMLQNQSSLMWEICGGYLENVTGKTAFDGCELGDETAQKVINEYLGYLCCGITNVINILEPDIICIGGGISAQGDKLIDPLSSLIRAERYSRTGDTTKLVTAALGNDAGIIGAGLLGCQY